MRACLTFLLLLVLIAVGSAIICYECDSMHNPHCNEYFAPEGVQQTNCDEAEMPEHLQKYIRRLPATGCMTKIHEGVDGERYFIRRSCYYGNLQNTREACDAIDPFLPFADILNCDVCNEDLCNTSAAERSVISPSAPLILSLSGLLIVLTYTRVK